jgi:FKBP-type peptidyl-prolyl cis-trans isomerase
MYTSHKTLEIRMISLGWLILAAVLFSSCMGNEQMVEQENKPSSMADSVVKYNQGVVRAENQEIEDYLIRHRLRMEETGTGLRYLFIKRGNGKKVEPGDRVNILYTVGLLTGDQIYSTLPDSGFIFKTGKGHVINGLEEGILLMNVGDVAKLVIPSHLAFGLLGDLDRIPNQAVLVYEVTVRAILP